MNSRKLIWTKRFSKDVKRAKRRNQNLESLQKVIKMLQSGDTLPQECKLHPLKGKYSGYMECHIEPDWLLRNGDEITSPSRRIDLGQICSISNHKS